MSDQDTFFLRAGQLLDRVEQLLPEKCVSHPGTAAALRWRKQGQQSILEPIQHLSTIRLYDLKCIERQIALIRDNTLQFLNNLPANNALLWGPRGTGKSSLIKAILNEYREQGLRMVEVESEHLLELPDIYRQLAALSGRFIIYCDDLSFEANDPSYKALKVILDGSLGTTPDNILIYATSNRRHLMPEYMRDNELSGMVGGELHLNEAIEEKLSLSERFGLWLSFHPFNQEQYLSIVDHWLDKLAAPDTDRDTLQRAALKWALEHGSRSGRTAWHFARDWTGKKRLQEL